MSKCNSKEEIVKENLENIKGWLAEGKSKSSIAKALKISTDTLYKYLEKYLGSLDDIKKFREPAVQLLEDTMLRSATGYERKVKKYQKCKRVEYNTLTGNKISEVEEMVEYEETVYYPPETAAGIFLLKNWANYMNEPRTIALREKELELKEKLAETW